MSNMNNDMRPELFPIRTVSSLTGVNSVTLRAWERRYGLIRPRRTEKGHRLYSRDDIDLINRVLAMLEKGVSIGQVRDALARQASAEEGGRATDAWSRYRARMIAAIIRFDEAVIEDAYNEALSLYPISEVTDRLIVPLLVELGRRWETAEGSVAEEHFFSVYLRNKLGARFHHRSRNAQGPRLLCACLPGEQHVTGLLLFALSAVDRDFRVILLGADLPIDELLMAQKRAGADCVVLSSAIESERSMLERDLPLLVQRIGVPIVVGGPGSVRHRDEITRAGALSLGEYIHKGLDRLASILLAKNA